VQYALGMKSSHLRTRHPRLSRSCCFDYSTRIRRTICAVVLMMGSRSSRTSLRRWYIPQIRILRESEHQTGFRNSIIQQCGTAFERQDIVDIGRYVHRLRIRNIGLVVDEPKRISVLSPNRRERTSKSPVAELKRTSHSSYM
jgi:hypothetical protein